jgi:hypothetical protein
MMEEKFLMHKAQKKEEDKKVKDWKIMQQPATGSSKMR